MDNISRIVGEYLEELATKVMNLVESVVDFIVMLLCVDLSEDSKVSQPCDNIFGLTPVVVKA